MAETGSEDFWRIKPKIQQHALSAQMEVMRLVTANCSSSVCRQQTTFKYANNELMSLQCAHAVLAK